MICRGHYSSSWPIHLSIKDVRGGANSDSDGAFFVGPLNDMNGDDIANTDWSVFLRMVEGQTAEICIAVGVLRIGAVVAVQLNPEDSSLL